MKRKLRLLLVVTLAVLMTASAATGIVSMVMGASAQTAGTSTPTHLYDFGTKDIPVAFSQTADMTIRTYDGYTTFKSTGSDPQTYVHVPGCAPNKARYASIC